MAGQYIFTGILRNYMFKAVVVNVSKQENSFVSWKK